MLHTVEKVNASLGSSSASLLAPLASKSHLGRVQCLVHAQSMDCYWAAALLRPGLPPCTATAQSSSPRPPRRGCTNAHTLRLNTFDVSHGSLTVGGEQYRGTAGPSGQIEPGTRIEWVPSSDPNASDSWELCRPRIPQWVHWVWFIIPWTHPCLVPRNTLAHRLHALHSSLLQHDGRLVGCWHHALGRIHLRGQWRPLPANGGVVVYGEQYWFY